VSRPREVIATEEPRRERGSIIGLANFMLRHGRLVFGLPLLFATTAVVFTVVRGARYRAESKFTSQQTESSGSARFAGIAAQFGIDLQAATTAEPLEFFVELLTSQQLLRDAATSAYVFPVESETNGTRRGTLVQLYGIKRKSPELAVRAAVKRLRANVSASPNVRSKIITLRTSAPWPGLAVALNQRLLQLVNEFNLHRRQSQASEERKFVAQRLNVALGELTSTENDLKRFHQENRGFMGSADLRIEEQRLQRRVDLRQQVYASLAEAYEKARIDEVRNTPVITIVDPPGAPARRGGLLTNALLGLFAGLVVGTVAAIAGEYFRREAAEDPQAAWELRRRMAFWRQRLPGFRRDSSRAAASEQHLPQKA
jgi:uncharacterized protein involved in exopolysaccharide biosynthesis